MRTKSTRMSLMKSGEFRKYLMERVAILKCKEKGADIYQKS